MHDIMMDLTIALDHPHADSVMAAGRSMASFASDVQALEMTVELEGVRQRYRMIEAPGLHYNTASSPEVMTTRWAPIGGPESIGRSETR